MQYRSQVASESNGMPTQRYPTSQEGVLPCTQTEPSATPALAGRQDQLVDESSLRQQTWLGGQLTVFAKHGCKAPASP
jgi:hypothetical protein